MKASLQDLCNRFIEARDLIKHTFKWENNYIHPVCANLFCAKGVAPEADKLRACRDLINSKTGIFSSFRGYIRIPLACMLSMEDDPSRKLDRALDMYKRLKEHFFGSDYLALAAFMLTQYDCTHERIARGKRIYRLMKEGHPFLTSSEDSVFAVMMAMSEQTDEELVASMEACYRLLKERFHDSNCVQTMAHVLAMEEGDAYAKCDKVFALYDTIAQHGRKYGKHHELATLAALATINAAPDVLARDVIDADSFLSGQKGYGFFGIDKKTRLMHAAMIASDEYMPRGAVDTAALTGTVSMLIAQQMAMCAIMASNTAMSAASAASNS
ncbi:MAG: DUF4003 domain-containing protein [Clostridia bacterium]|nr:DUF4003 domain-containing protein [Clostridia bacterium]